MQQQPQTPSVPGQAPQPFVVQESQIPRTGEEVQAIRLRLNDLRRELQDAAERRNSVMRRMEDAPSRAQSGLEGRLAELDARIIGLEREITRNNVLLNQAPAGALIAGTTQEPHPAEVFDRIAGDLVPIVGILSVFVFAPIAIAIARFFWRRSGPPARAAGPDPLTQQKLDHLQQAVDTIAIEIERVSEGQRFVTKLLNERHLGAGPAEQVPNKPGIGVERR